MAKAFGDAMVKLSLLGQDKSKMVDCSEVIPRAKPLRSKSYFPANLTVADLEKTVSLFNIHNHVFFVLNVHVFVIVREAVP